MRNKIKELIKQLNYYTYWYDLGEPKISDTEFDNLYFELEKLEKETGIIFSNSPTQSIPYNISNGLEKVKHNHPLLSLAKTKSIDDVCNFVKDNEFVLLPKLDGLTVAARYIDGKLVSLETRGDSLIGENILHNAIAIKNLPQEIPYKGELLVDGEAIITYKDFEEFKDEYANPRNLVSGSIRLLNSKESAKRNISFIAWKLYNNPNNYNIFSRKLDFLSSIGFDVAPYIIGNKEKCEEQINSIKSDMRDKFSYPIDGVVVAINDITIAESYGEGTSHHIAWELAYKFADDKYETDLLNIEWSMGRNGKLTPIAVFSEIYTGDSYVKKSSLHNLSVLKNLSGGIEYIGDRITVIKSNDIIPMVIKWKHRLNNNEKQIINRPTTCPYCHDFTQARVEDNTENLYCLNTNCCGKINNIIKHYVDITKGVGVKGLSEKTIDFLMDKKWLKSIKDIYTLSEYKNEWIKEQGFGVTSVNKILAAIEQSKEVDLYKFISAIGIDEIGLSSAKDIANHFKDWNSFRKATYKDLISIDNIGDIIANNILNYDYSIVDFIAENYIVFKAIEEKGNNSLQGLSFCVTGKLSKSRKLIEQDICAVSGKVVSSVTSNTDFLVCNDKDSNSTKMSNARKLNIPIINEQELYGKINN